MHDLNPICEIRESNRTSFFNFMCTVFLQSISYRLHTYEGETFGSFDFFNWPPESHVTGNQRNAQSNIFLESSIVACINFSNKPLKEAKL